jgi:ribosome biogenesis GTPase
MIDLKQYGYTEAEPVPDGLLPARVSAVHKERYELLCHKGTRFGKLKTRVYYGREPQSFPTVGDFVLCEEVEGGDCQITATLPRKSAIIRRDPNPEAGEQAVAANMDYAFIMTSLNRDFNINRIQRYLVLTRQSGAEPVVILTKADLVEDAAVFVSQIQAAAGGVGVIPVSVVNGVGLDKLEGYLTPGKTAVFFGMSGVGKSSLLNALMGHDVMAVRQTRRVDAAKGSHTTTHRQLFMLPNGAMVIDTPGMRSLGLWDAEDGLRETFADIEALLGTCRFSDCRHQNEPDCAVRAAIENGELTAGRWENYQKLQREAAYAENKAAQISRKKALYKDSMIQYRKNLKNMKKHGGLK